MRARLLTFALLIACGLTLACAPEAVLDGEVCSANVRVRFSSPDPLEGSGDRGDAGRVAIVQNGQKLFDQTVVLSRPEDGEVVPVVDLETQERPELLAGERFEVTLHFYSSTSRRLFALGRTDVFRCLDETEVDVPVYVGPANAFASTAPIPGARTGSLAVPLDEQRVLIFGGEDEDGAAAIPSAFLYDHATGEHCGDCIEGAPDSRMEHSATRLADGRVVIVGGRLAGDTALVDEVSVFDPVTSSFGALPGVAIARKGHSATLIEGSNAGDAFVAKLLVAGGEDDDGMLDTLVVLDVETPALEAVSTRLASPRRDMAAVMMTSGRVLLSGGRGANGAPTGYLDYFDTELGSVERPEQPCMDNSTSESLCARRAGHTATVLADDNVLLAGGDVAPLEGTTDVPTTEVVLLASDRAKPGTATPDALSPRRGHAAAALPCVDNECPVLLTGGEDPTTGAAVAPALFYPSGSPTPENAGFYEGTVTSFTRLDDEASRVGHDAVLLPDGTVYVVGGTDPAGTSTKEAAAVYTRCTVPQPAQLTCPQP